MKILTMVVCLFMFTSWTSAQDEASAEYIWLAGDLSLIVPSGWDAPLPNQDSLTPVLQLAQTLVDAPDMRPPGIPIITLKIIPSVSADLAALLSEELRSLGLESFDASTQASLLGGEAVEISGVSADGLLFGTGRVATISDTEVLLVTGRALAVQRDSFVPLFDTLTNGLNSSRQPFVPASTYGVAWHTLRSQADGAEGFLNLVGLVYSAERLYTYERDLGVIEIDTLTGEILTLTPNADITAPSDIAGDPDGRLFVADTACACIFTLEAGAWRDGSIVGFAEGEPSSITVAADRSLYATHREADGTISVRIYASGNLQSTITLDAGLFEAPRLTTDTTGRVLALTQYGEVLALSSSGATPLFTLNSLPPSVTDFAVDAENNLLFATADFGLIVVNQQGDEIDRPGSIVPNFPLAGEFVSPKALTIAPDGTLYVADSDTSFGAVTALSKGVSPGRVGSPALALGLAVQGTLSTVTPQQTWTYAGSADQRLTLSALHPGDQLNVALRLLAPDGSEIAYNDDQLGEDLLSPSDAHIAEVLLPETGMYIVVVERVDGEGAYRLGISETRTLTLGADGVSTLEGEITDVFPVERWQFEGQAGQTFTITMQPTTGTLDPALRLIGLDGTTIVAENDDAADPILGTSAQIFAAQLPASGTYTLEARRFEGEGRYELVIVAIA